ncbi:MULTISPECIES: cupin domain-containing protein [unclassified Sinorhizobium]|uniref:(R)-mandelonitrile lyase n=1 Tax=unclassified Sinorhizobium TaxID=2613772 RepID=UPI0035253645
MKTLAAILAPFALLAASANAETMEVRKPAAAPGTAENFTGDVLVAPLFSPAQHSQTSGGHVTFEAGARSAWHSHPAGQTLIVTSGTGWVQEEGGKKREIRPGDVIWTPPGVMHWHGATDDSAMSHIAITEVVDGSNVEWMQKVTDAQYLD